MGWVGFIHLLTANQTKHFHHDGTDLPGLPHPQRHGHTPRDMEQKLMVYWLKCHLNEVIVRRHVSLFGASLNWTLMGDFGATRLRDTKQRNIFYKIGDRCGSKISDTSDPLPWFCTEAGFVDKHYVVLPLICHPFVYQFGCCPFNMTVCSFGL